MLSPRPLSVEFRCLEEFTGIEVGLFDATAMRLGELLARHRLIGRLLIVESGMLRLYRQRTSAEEIAERLKSTREDSSTCLQARQIDLLFRKPSLVFEC